MIGCTLLLISENAASFVPAQEDSTRRTGPDRAPVIFGGDTLFFIEAKVGSFSPAERAKAVSSRMTRLLKNYRVRADSVTVSDGETGMDLSVGDLIVMTVTENDAKAAGVTKQRLAHDCARKMGFAFKKQAASTGLKKIVLGGVFTLITTAAFILILKLLKFLSQKLYAKLNQLRNTRIFSLKIQKLEVLSADRIADILILTAKTLRIALFLILLDFYLTLVFSFFPWTKGLASILIGYILSPASVVWRAFLSFLPNVFFIAVISAVTHYINKFVRWIFNEVGKGTIVLPGFYRDWAEPTFQIVRFLIIAFAAIVIFPYLPGSSSPAFRGVGVFFGLLFSLGSTSAVSNIISGVVLTYTRAFNNGDRVKIADTMGDVVERTLLVTRIRTIKNMDITIPNAMVLGSHVINFSSSAAQRGLILHTNVTISYDIPWKKVHDLLLSAAGSTQNVLQEPAPFVLQVSLDDFYVNYELNVYTNKPNVMAAVYSELHQNIQDKFNEANVEIMSPHFSSIRDGNRTSIPEQYLPETYTPSPFRIDSLSRWLAGRNTRPPG